MPIPLVSGFTVIRALGIGSGDASLVVDSVEGRWVCKSDSGEGSSWEGIRAEAVGWLLSKRLGAPVPEAAAMKRAEQGQTTAYFWLSAFIEAPVHWHPTEAAQVHNLGALGRSLAIDALLYNTDRHGGNILLQPDPTESRLRVWAIDMDHCLAGWPDDLLAKGIEAPPPGKLARVPLDALRQEALDTARAAAIVPEADLRDMAQEACNLVDDVSRAANLATALINRSRSANTIVEQYLDNVARIWNA